MESWYSFKKSATALIGGGFFMGLMKKIKLTQGKYALIDDKDFDNLSTMSWQVHKLGNNYYAYHCSNIKGKTKNIKMHRYLLNYPTGMDIDHINGNGLDNRRENLRICTRSENLRNSKLRNNNTSGYKGVSWSKMRKKWIVQIRFDNKSKCLGFYSDKIRAAHIYDLVSLDYYGDYARTNFPIEDYQK